MTAPRDRKREQRERLRKTLAVHLPNAEPTSALHGERDAEPRALRIIIVIAAVVAMAAAFWLGHP